jgi:hypothetical protein
LRLLTTSALVNAVRDAGGRVTAGAMRWRDGKWLRHPSRERIVKALGEPLVVVRRSAVNDVLAVRQATSRSCDGVAGQRRIVVVCWGVAPFLGGDCRD